MLIEEIDQTIVQAHHLLISRDEFPIWSISAWTHSNTNAAPTQTRRR